MHIVVVDTAWMDTVSLVSVLFIATQIDYIRCALFLNSSWFSFLAISIFIVEVEFLFFLLFDFYSFCFLLFLLRFFFFGSYSEFILIHGSFNFSFGFSFFEFLFRQISSCFYCSGLSRRLPPFDARDLV